eukprot:TRINITY_DN2128_c0_g1_i1.p2 TRINITY_DN2128_c0_g1~~TRINITY_DN2128_c0_g1_i1.p2  ORF type:complete len:248 (+),score=109.01 TRINITY_DN2128_c0_g1_i1:58-801(+)
MPPTPSFSALALLLLALHAGAGAAAGPALCTPLYQDTFDGAWAPGPRGDGTGWYTACSRGECAVDSGFAVSGSSFRVGGGDRDGVRPQDVLLVVGDALQPSKVSLHMAAEGAGYPWTPRMEFVGGGGAGDDSCFTLDLPRGAEAGRFHAFEVELDWAAKSVVVSVDGKAQAAEALGCQGVQFGIMMGGWVDELVLETCTAPEGGARLPACAGRDRATCKTQWEPFCGVTAIAEYCPETCGKCAPRAE